MEVVLMQERKGKCKYALCIQFVSRDDLIKFLDDIKKKKDDLGVVRVEWIEKRALDKANHLVKRKEEKQRERSVTLGSEKAFLEIMGKFSNGEDNVIIKEGQVKF